MRTKALLVTAAVAAVSLATSFAQVYSVNVVGYVNVPVGGGFTCIANPLDATPDNNVNNVMPVAPDGTQVLKWTGTGFSSADTFFEAGPGWFDESFNPSVMTVAPGEGFFVNNPGAATTLTFVGEVRQGSLSNYLASGFNLVSQLTPQSGSVMSFNFPAGDGDQILYWNSSTQRYTDAITFFEAGPGWFDAEFNPVSPDVNVGQGFFVNKINASAWTLTFNVNTP